MLVAQVMGAAAGHIAAEGQILARTVQDVAVDVGKGFGIAGNNQMLVVVGFVDRDSVEEVEVSIEGVESLDFAAAGSMSAVPVADNKGSSAGLAQRLDVCPAPMTEVT